MHFKEFQRLLSLKSNNSDSCQDKYEEYMAKKDLSTVGTFLNVIHVNSTIIPEKPHVNVEDDQRFFLGYQLVINSSNDLDNYQNYYGIFRNFAKQMIQSSLNFTNNYFKYSSNDSFVHLNQKYFEDNSPEKPEPTINSTLLRIYVMIFLILFIIFLAECVFFTSWDALKIVLRSVDYQIEIIRTTNILNPPTPRPAEPITSAPKLAPQPVLERSFSSAVSCDNLFTTDQSNSNHDISEIEMDETQSVTSFVSFKGNSSNV